MSTRATYQFKTRLGKVTFYVHCDGYPEGAAIKFRQMHDCENRKGSLADRFHRGVEDSEITGDHNTHGDTDYQYTIDQNGILVARSVRDNGIFFVGLYAEFINKYDEEGEKLRLVATGHSSEWITRTALATRLAEKLRAMDEYTNRFPEHTGNISGYRMEVRALENALKEFDVDAVEITTKTEE